MLVKFNPGAARSPLVCTGGRLVIPGAVTARQWGQMAGRLQRPTKLDERLGLLVQLRGGAYLVYTTVHLHVNR